MCLRLLSTISLLPYLSLQRLDMEYENPWEFDTVRGRSVPRAPSTDEQFFPDIPDDSSLVEPTIRPPPPSSALPSSLRLLFEDESNLQSDPLRSLAPQSVPVDPANTPPLDMGNEPGSSTTSGRSNQTYREVRSFRGVPNIEIPPLLPSSDLTHTNPFLSLSVSSPDLLMNGPKLVTGRKRSQSSDDGFSSRDMLTDRSDQDPTSPCAFRAPPTFSRARPSTAHPEAVHLTNGVTENESSQPVLPNRQRSTPTSDNTTLATPIKPFARAQRERSGSSSSDGNISIRKPTLILPGLKDVLKVSYCYLRSAVLHDFVKVPLLTSEHQFGMSDLLPPSPSAVLYNARSFAPSPSLLNSEVTHVSISKDGASVASTSPLGRPGSNSPHLSDVRTTMPDTSPSAIWPLDFGRVILSHEATQVELARTIDHLKQWLFTVEAGLDGMLDQINEDTIAEEQEDATTDVDEESEYIDYLRFGYSLQGMNIK